MLVAEGTRLTRTYAEQGRLPAAGEIEARLAWEDPARGVRVAREMALERIAAGDRLRCVWSERWAEALAVERNHGTLAPVHVAPRIGELATLGDMAGVERWREIGRANG